MGMASQALVEWVFEWIESKRVVRVCMQRANLTTKRREQAGLAVARGGGWGTTSVLEFGQVWRECDEGMFANVLNACLN